MELISKSLLLTHRRPPGTGTASARPLPPPPSRDRRGGRRQGGLQHSGAVGNCCPGRDGFRRRASRRPILLCGSGRCTSRRTAPTLAPTTPAGRHPGMRCCGCCPRTETGPATPVGTSSRAGPWRWQHRRWVVDRALLPQGRGAGIEARAPPTAPPPSPPSAFVGSLRVGLFSGVEVIFTSVEC